jgi:hypothetical protein
MAASRGSRSVLDPNAVEQRARAFWIAYLEQHVILTFTGAIPFQAAGYRSLMDNVTRAVLAAWADGYLAGWRDQ